MQKPFIIGLSLLASVASITTARAGETLDRVKENKELIAVMDQSYPPYSFLNDKNEEDGFDVDVVKEVAKRLGVTAKIQTPSWEVITAGHWRGRWDICICSMTPDEKKAKVLDFVAPYYSAPAVLITNAIGSAINKVSDIDGKRIAIEQGSSYERYLQKDLVIGFGAKPIQYPFKQVQALPYSSEDLAYQDLALGYGKRVDAIVSNLVTANKRISANPGKYQIIGQPLYEEPNWVAVDKGDQEWNNTIKQIISDLHQDGTLKKLSLKWVGNDITQS
ncbi:MAG: transporter substrate-binding domain-containing protein [Tolumonas sp.]|nr:MAG: transporter substrate-binding domain-containing protein [Tolumonas sp.]